MRAGHRRAWRRGCGRRNRSLCSQRQALVPPPTRLRHYEASACFMSSSVSQCTADALCGPCLTRSCVCVSGWQKDVCLLLHIRKWSFFSRPNQTPSLCSCVSCSAHPQAGLLMPCSALQAIEAATGEAATGEGTLLPRLLWRGLHPAMWCTHQGPLANRWASAARRQVLVASFEIGILVSSRLTAASLRPTLTLPADTHTHGWCAASRHETAA